MEGNLDGIVHRKALYRYDAMPNSKVLRSATLRPGLRPPIHFVSLRTFEIDISIITNKASVRIHGKIPFWF